AEDGIRDFHVTGVQTCALPIYPARRPHLFPPRQSGRTGGALQRVPVDFQGKDRSTRKDLSGLRQSVLLEPLNEPARMLPACRDRSEERRVGKECRHGWATRPST